MSTRRFTHVAPPPVRVVVALGAVLVVLLALVVTAGRAGAEPTPVTGSVDWGVKQSFRNYVVGPIAHGSITPGGGTTTNGDNTFHFGSGTGTVDGSPQAIDLATSGSVQFAGHDGVLDVTISNVRVDIDGTTGTLVADVVTRPFTSTTAPPAEPVAYDDVALAALDLSGTVPSISGLSHTFANVPATLTSAGVPAFAGFYAAGDALDPVTIRFDVTPPATSSTTTSTVPEESSTTSSSSVPEGSSTTTSTAPTTPTTDPTEESDVTGGHLDWGVKQRFRSYVTGPIAQGAITTGGSTTTDVDGTFRFPATGGTAGADGGSFDATFAGSVRFTGHGGELDLFITGLEVEAVGDTGVLVADVTSHAIGASSSVTYDDVELAALDLSAVTPGSSGLTVTWAGIEAALTEAGVPAFGDFYEAGEPFDALTVVLDVEATTVAPGGDGGNGGGGDGGDGATTDGTSYAAGSFVTVGGRGFMAGEQVEVWLFSEPRWVGTTVAASDGSVSFTFALPYDLPAGQHHVELRGITSGVVLSSAAFTVSGSAATPVRSASGALPYTGADSLAAGAAGAALLAAGAGLAVAARRRTRTSG